MGKIMKHTKRLFTILAISLVFLSGCTSQVYHDYIMSGQVAAVDGKEVVVCVSNTDGLKMDDVFNVYRVVFDNGTSSEGDTNYSLIQVGKIRLGQKQDMHFAKATVLTGDLRRYDMIEFDKD
jgi:hypothetical protein